ncbi:MAG: 1,4-alpha-glucan branching protein, partial [Flavisolibacter sp.]|nr:1,4-alpha-glucan branching protein [Flavisolibacter sp.]
IKAWFTSNHDENSWNGTEYEKYGNAAKALTVFSCTWPGVPLIYSGQELPNLKRLQFFEKDPIEWTGRYELHNFYKILFQLHSTHPALLADEQQTQTIRLHTPDDASLFAYLRRNGNKEVLVILNLSNASHSFELSDSLVSGSYKNAFTEGEHNFSNSRMLEVKAWEYLVFEK